MNYDLTTPANIENSADTARIRANNEPNQSSYNAAYLHGYAAALRDVAEQLNK